MRQLNGFDAGFLHLESPTQQGHIGGVVVLDPSTCEGDWGIDTLRSLIQERLHLLPPFRSRLLRVPFDLDQPYWVDDPDFDLDFHLRHIAIPAPGGSQGLADLVARIHERPLDRGRPLWEMYLIEGLEGGRVATYTKLHHAAVDGLSGAEILSTLVDEHPHGREVPAEIRPWNPGPIPGPMHLVGRSALRTVVSPVKVAGASYRFWRAVAGLNPLMSVPAILGGKRHHDELLMRPSLVAPRSRLNRPITPHRRWAYGAVSLDEVKAVKNSTGTTVNDVVISICAGAVRRWLLDHGDLPEESLQALIPISVRTPDEKHDFANKVSGVVALIGTHLEDPVERLEFVHGTMEAAKEFHGALPATLLQDFAQFAPPAVAARAARMVFRHGRANKWTPVNLVISNVPGPRTPLYLAGAEIEGHFPVSTITDGIGLNITVISYRDQMCFGLVADRELMPDVWVLFRYLEESLSALLERTT